MIEALFDAFSPLRWCMFTEPVNCYRGTSVKLEAVLANEDVLPAGEYPARVEVFGPNGERVFERTLSAKVPVSDGKAATPMAIPVFCESVKADWPTGKYRCIATFERGAAAAGRAAEFYVADPADMSKVDAEVTLWGEDAGLSKWLADRGIRVRPFTPEAQTGREVILVSNKPAAPGDAAAFGHLVRHIARGSVAVFLSPQVFAKGNQATAWLPLKNKGNLVDLPSCIYHKDEWTKRHPIFDGLPCGGLMDYTYYREIIGPRAFSGQDGPAEAVAGGILSCPAYASGLFVSVNDLGGGRFILNSLRILENLGKNPAADRLLVNMLRYAARDTGKPCVELPANFDGQLKALQAE
jgi:hypothetical protein